MADVAGEVIFLLRRRQPCGDVERGAGLADPGNVVALAIANPVAAALIAVILVILSLWLVLAARRALKRLLEPKRRPAG